jgi:hypothetical protein
MTMLLSTHQFQEASFNTRGFMLQHQDRTGIQKMTHLLKEFLGTHQETEKYPLRQGTLKPLSFHQHQVYTGANNANIR